MKTKEEFFQARKAKIDAYERPGVLFAIRDGRLIVRIDGDETEYDTGLDASDFVKNQFDVKTTNVTVEDAFRQGLLEAHNGSIHANFR